MSLSGCTISALSSNTLGWVKDRQLSAVEIRDALPGMYDDNGLPTPGYEQAFWMKTRTKFEGDSEAQKVALAYASDFYLLSTVPKALGNSRNIKMMASLDHSMWFYDTFDVSEWVLFLVSLVMQRRPAEPLIDCFFLSLGLLLFWSPTLVILRSSRPLVDDGTTRTL